MWISFLTYRFVFNLLLAIIKYILQIVHFYVNCPDSIILNSDRTKKKHEIINTVLISCSMHLNLLPVWTEIGSRSLFLSSQTTQLNKKWLIRFNVSKTYLVTFHHRRSDTALPPVTMNGCPLGKDPWLVRLFGIKPALQVKLSHKIHC